MMSLSYPDVKEWGESNRKTVKQHYSVAFPIGSFGALYELKVWHKSPDYLSLLVHENSAAVLPRLKVGETLRMNYYTVDLARPSEQLETEVLKVKKNHQGRLRGQYLVDLQILKSYH
jgi:hypothetical protein